MTKSSTLKIVVLLLTEAPIWVGALARSGKKLLRPSTPTEAPADLSEDSLTGTDLSTPTERKQLELGYETVQKDDKEVQALADVTLRTTIESTSASEEPDYRAIDVLLNPDLLKQVERDNAAKAVPFNKEDDMRDYGRELMEKSRALRLQKTNCEATDPMSYWIAHPHGDSGRSIKWTVSLKLEMDDPEDGFRIREVSNSFGKNYDPKLAFQFERERLRTLEEESIRVILPRGSETDLTDEDLEDLCRRQIKNYANFAARRAKVQPPFLDPYTKPEDLKGIVMWLLGHNYRTAPVDLLSRWNPHDDLMPNHKLTVIGRPPKLQELEEDVQ